MKQEEAKIGEYVFCFSGGIYCDIDRLQILETQDGRVFLKKKFGGEWFRFHEIFKTKQEAFEHQYELIQMQIIDQTKKFNDRIKELQSTKEYDWMIAKRRILKI
jgi:hypothetical protein